MTVSINSSSQEKNFNNQKIITIGSSPIYDFYLKNSPEQFYYILERSSDGNYVLKANSTSGPKFKGQPFKQITVSNVVRLMFDNSQEFINIKISQDNVQKSLKEIENEDFDGNDIKNLYNDDKSAQTRIKLDKLKSKIDEERVAIIKEVSYKINDLNQRISQNLKGKIFTHIALFFGSMVCAFAVTNYLTGLSIKESADYIHLPTDLQLWTVYTILIFGVFLIFKHGFYGYFQSKTHTETPKMSVSVQYLLTIISTLIIFGVYSINLLYYLNYTHNPVFPVLISMFFVLITAALAVSSAYLKSNGSELTELLNRYEYREDFEKVMNEYQKWVGHFVNNLSSQKKEYVKERIFRLHIKEVFETLTGIITAPFLAYGVSNTLAMCFPEAAGWIRISGLRFSPVFLVLATFLIIFAFFLFVHGFTVSKKISNSTVIKQDGFSNYLEHCTELFGLAATKRAKKEMSSTFFIATAIILIEFTMNVSYFSGEIGQDLTGLFMSFTAALVPTALLIAETFLLSGTKFKIYACDEIFARADK